MGYFFAEKTSNSLYLLMLIMSQNLPKLMRTIDHLNQVMGRTIKLVDELLSVDGIHKQFNLSRRYTTSWSELLQVRS